MRVHLTRSPISAPAFNERVRGSDARGFATNVRASLLVLAFILTSAFLLTFVMLYTVGSLVEHHCSANFGYYGCDTQY
jgi:hypothetical protein